MREIGFVKFLTAYLEHFTNKLWNSSVCGVWKNPWDLTSLFLWKMQNLNQPIADIYVQTLLTKYLARQHLPLPQTDSDQKAWFLPMNFNRMSSQLRIGQRFQMWWMGRQMGPWSNRRPSLQRWQLTAFS